MGRELALNKPATASDFVAPFTPAKAVDGTVMALNRWVGAKPPHWFKVDLGKSYWIQRWLVTNMGADRGWGDQYNPGSLTLEGSQDNNNWYNIDSVNNPQSTSNRTFLSCSARFVRVKLDNGLRINKGVASFLEFQVYEADIAPYLSSLTISPGTLTPAFDYATYSYTASVDNTVPFVTVTPTALNSQAAIRVNNNPVQSGHPISVELAEGSNTINVQVTLSNMEQTYTINVTKASSAQLLSSLILKNNRGVVINLNPDFEREGFYYTAQIANTVSFVTVTPTAENGAAANIQVNGQTVQSGHPSQGINMAAGLNTILTDLSAGGSPPTTYKIDITKSE